MTTSLALLILAAALSAWLVVRSIRDHRKAMAARHGLLDEAWGLIVDAERVIGPDHYPVGPEVVEAVRCAFGDTEDLLVTHDGRTHLDLWSANARVLREAGVGQIEIARLCTACHTENFFSHRAESGKTGRFGAVIALS